MVAQQRWDELVDSLLAHHYDPAYHRSLARNFSRLETFTSLPLTGPGENEIAQLADTVLGLQQAG
jgi:hypothetical protein